MNLQNKNHNNLLGRIVYFNLSTTVDLKYFEKLLQVKNSLIADFQYFLIDLRMSASRCLCASVTVARLYGRTSSVPNPGIHIFQFVSVKKMFKNSFKYSYLQLIVVKQNICIARLLYLNVVEHLSLLQYWHDDVWRLSKLRSLQFQQSHRQVAIAFLQLLRPTALLGRPL